MRQRVGGSHPGTTCVTCSGRGPSSHSTGVVQVAHEANLHVAPVAGKWHGCCRERVNDEQEPLRTAYGDLCELAVELTEATSWQPSGCVGWTVRDLLLHHLSDAQRALVALATVSPNGLSDRNAVTYWIGSSGRSDPESRHLRATRTIASAYSFDGLQNMYVETLQAVIALAARVEPSAIASTQGHTLRVDDLLSTLVTEAALHHLDLVAHLDARGPSRSPLAVVRSTLDGLFGRPAPTHWDDETWALIGTGRKPLGPSERAALGADAVRLPLLS